MFMKSNLDNENSMHEVDMHLHNKHRDTNLSIGRKYKKVDYDNLENNLRHELLLNLRRKWRQMVKYFNNLFKEFRHFWFRLFPYYLPGATDPSVLEAKHHHYLEKLKYEPMFIKPGRDMYTTTFVLELIILIFFIISYSNLNGDSISFKEGLTRSRFSGNLVIVIIIFILLICLNRISFKLKFATLDSNSNAVNPVFDKSLKSKESTRKNANGKDSQAGKVLNFGNYVKNTMESFNDIEENEKLNMSDDTIMDKSLMESRQKNLSPKQRGILRTQKNKERIE